MTFGQEDVLRYLKTQFVGCKMEPIGESIIRVTDKTGETMDFSCNIFGDILEIKDGEKHKIVAESDLPHSLDTLPMLARPKSWTTLPY